MNNNSQITKENNQSEAAAEQSNQTPLRVHNPLDKNDERKVTQEEIDNEQKFKEALTERD